MSGKYKLIIGLGNPGEDYQNTYHNVGKSMIDYLSELMSDQKPNFKKVKTFEFLKTPQGILVKPLVFMNESGKAIQDLIRFFDSNPEEILIVHDDSDLEIGTYKLKKNQNAAGHHGIESIIEKLKTKNFWRLRIGIRPKLENKKRAKAETFVLKKISRLDQSKLYGVFGETMEKLTEKV
jgi:PTH1 family peptidyl-tRNA hydrolase